MFLKLNKKRLNYIIVIPARMKSKRLPGKPLIQIEGIPMVIRTYLQCIKVVKKELVYVATDSPKIQSICRKFGAQSILTSKKCMTGTDRVAEVSKFINSNIYINVQGDEPIFDPKDLTNLIKSSLKNPRDIITGYCDFNDERMYNDLNIPKFVINKKQYLLYASRASIPSNKKGKLISAKRQICAYSFPKDSLNIFGKLKDKTPLESIEDIEILRFIELGLKVRCVKMSGKSLAVDNKFDLKLVTQRIKKNKKLYG